MAALLTVGFGAPILIAVLALLFLGLSLRFPWIAAYTALISAFLTMPAGVPTQVPVAGISMYTFEPFLYLAALVAILRLPAVRSTDIASLSIVTILLLGSLLSLSSGTSAAHVVSDVRSLGYFTAALFVAGRFAASLHTQDVPRLTSWILWISAALMLFSSVTGIPVAGRQEEATLYLEGSGTGNGAATRIITGTTNLALPVLAGWLALWVVGKSPKGTAIRFMLPALLISFLGFSRNTLLGVGAAILFALLVTGSSRGWNMAFKRLLAVSASIIVIYVLLPVLQILPGSSFIGGQLISYGSRVIDGLSQQTLAVDTSVLYRERENFFLFQAIREQPLMGHGFGYAYKPGEGETGSFWADKGTIYAHNFYLWVVVKTGLLGLVAWFCMSAAPLLRAIRHREPTTLFLASGTIALLAVSVVAPMPIGSVGSVAIGGFLGAAWVIRLQGK
ncbi:O-antigen ligase [Arthrobacter sp. PvP102]|uniref:O-antigen ligase family protein n=1 Tax=unclassified Arthrobacter TaxID=235627 RepID=UPI001AE12211|nr:MULTISPECIES: O-antigen ligase family protein [unclassified Arthrobacter]MBP1232513.1 O-antigen ligase [Arthrobacter sp. PvP103]MBP1237648.1 O-antigen ligase [Arthrobacter sp. PvP102]